MKEPVIILAGGFGERTRGTLGKTPKVLIKTADGKTILDHILQDLENSGLKATIVTNGVFYEQIKSYMQSKGPAIGSGVINDQKMIPEERLGALGDLLYAIDSKRGRPEENILVLPSDTAYWESFSISDFLSFASEHPNNFVTVAYDVGDKNKIKGNLGCVLLDENSSVVDFEEKPEVPKSTLAIIAIYLFRSKHIELLREFKEQGGNLNSPSNIIPFLMKKGINVSAFVSKGRVIDANGPSEISEAANY